MLDPVLEERRLLICTKSVLVKDQDQSLGSRKMITSFSSSAAACVFGKSAHEVLGSQGSGSKIKDQDQGSGSRIRIKDQDQGSRSRIRIKDQD